jgi:hypothetical protein
LLAIGFIFRINIPAEARIVKIEIEKEEEGVGLPKFPIFPASWRTAKHGKRP